ncbi:cytosine permease [Dehalococcoides sp.]|uniref:cytosine permease n=1 Tax=Dehalococcoides sp. TaxID=1966486 RepID=UPI002ACB17E1|nr:cytosine permease [Dehalococcoides sp.]
MSQYPIENQNYYSYQYQALQWQGVVGTLMGVVMLIAMGAWALSLVKKAFKGEEVKFPL